MSLPNPMTIAVSIVPALRAQNEPLFSGHRRNYLALGVDEGRQAFVELREPKIRKRSEDGRIYKRPVHNRPDRPAERVNDTEHLRRLARLLHHRARARG